MSWRKKDKEGERQREAVDSRVPGCREEGEGGGLESPGVEREREEEREERDDGDKKGKAFLVRKGICKQP